MERSWDYVVNSPTGIAFAVFASILVMIFIVGGGIFMRFVMQRQSERIRQETEEIDVKTAD